MAKLLYKGGSTVGKGTYWNPTDGRRVDIETEGVLPGSSRVSYLKLPPGGVIVIAPLFGLMYILFLPFFGIGSILAMWIVALVGFMGAVVLSAVKVCGGLVGKGASFGWHPSSAHIAGRRARAGRRDNTNK